MNNYSYIVRVREGSGVIVNPFTDNYSYILTARHNIQIDIDDPNKGYHINSDIRTYSGSNEVIEIVDRIISDELDIAILVTNRRLKSNVEIVTDSILSNTKLTLRGYPRDRRQGENALLGSIDYHFHKYEAEAWLVKTNENVSYDNLVGYSGGALFNADVRNESYELRAISSKKSGNIVKEFHGDIEVFPVEKFIDLLECEIKKRNNQFLKPILPYYLSSFANIKELVFQLTESWDDEEKLDDVCYCLRKHGIESVEVENVNLKPLDILNKYESFLNCNKHFPKNTKDISFWSSFFEILIISIIIDKPNEVNLDYVGEILRNRRLLYIDDNKVWKKHVENILKGHYEGLSLDGAIVVRTLAEDIECKFDNKRLKKLSDVRNISNKNRRDRHAIDNINRNTENDRYLIDLGALNRECLTKNEKKFDDWSISRDFELNDFESIVREEYSKIIS
ncbi:ABC-three component system protein [Vibrio sp. TBV020]|uniref:ABC-three component system protein n=1 Tax=Vibrio sp. TBV020 TaxID=3137398 RepID=UPI0038CD5AAB